jgi:phosphatidylcholine synthase
VHIFTAAGAAVGLAALAFAVAGQWTAMFLCLGVALIIDGVDGTIARYLKVPEALPRWSGDVLDLVVDFVTYVFVPAYAISAGGFLPRALALPAGALIVITAALYFADRNMKLPGNYFRGFPALWNVVAFYLFLLKPGPWLAGSIIIVFAVLTFVPIKFLHPLRVRKFRALNIAALLVWSVLALVAVVRGLDPGSWVVTAMLVIALYFLALGSIDRGADYPERASETA